MGSSETVNSSAHSYCMSSHQLSHQEGDHVVDYSSTLSSHLGTIPFAITGTETTGGDNSF